MSDPLEYPNEMLMRCAENCGSLRYKVAKLEAANKVLMEALDAIATDGLYGNKELRCDVGKVASDAIKAADDIMKENG